MRILNITAQKPDSTGSGVYLAELVRCQLAAGHASAVVCGIAKSDSVALAGEADVYPVRFETENLPFPVCGMSDEMPYPATRYRDLTPSMTSQFCDAFATTIQHAAKAFAPDMVICHHLYLVTAVARETLPHIPMGAVCHSTDLRQMEKHGLERQRILDAIRRLDVIYALHDEQKCEIVALYGVEPDRVQVVGTGFNAHVFAPREHPVSQTSDDTPKHEPLTLVYAGKIWRKKGVPNLIAALDAVHVEKREIILRLAGGYNDPQEYARIQQQAHACAHSVEFLGKLSQPDLAQAYQRAEIFVLPSFFEGLPLVVIEALACGCKVVMTDLPGIRPWIERNVPNAPLIYVTPPRMKRVDEPYEEDLPAFEQRLARALEQACALPWRACDVSNLSWERVSGRIVERLTDKR